MGCCGGKRATGNRGRSRLLKKRKILALKKEREEVTKKAQEEKTN